MVRSLAKNLETAAKSSLASQGEHRHVRCRRNRSGNAERHSRRVDIIVTTEGGSSASGTADEFTYRGVPTVSACRRTKGRKRAGPRSADDRDELHQHERSEVRLEGLDRSRIRSAGELIAKGPAGSGTADITMKTAGGTSTTGTARPVHLPRDAHGDSDLAEGRADAGGTNVTINGTNFTKTSEVRFGPNLATAVEFKSATELVVRPRRAAARLTCREDGRRHGRHGLRQGIHLPGTARGEWRVAQGRRRSGRHGRHDRLVKTSKPRRRLEPSAASRRSIPPTPAARSKSKARPMRRGRSTSWSARRWELATALGRRIHLPRVPTVTAISPSEGPEAGGTSVKVNGTGFRGRAK